VARDDIGRPGKRAGPDEIRFGSRRPAIRWRSRWLLMAAGAVLAAVVAVVALAATGHGKAPRPQPAAEVTEAGHRLLGVTAGWELFGYGPAGLVRVQLARGRVTRTVVPALDSTGPVSLAVGPNQAVVRPLDNVAGYLVPDGHPARSLSGALSHGGTVIPGPRPGTVWLQAGFQVTSLSLVRLDGSRTGVSMRLPPGGPSLPVPDGQGFALVSGASSGDLYDVRPGGFHRIAGSLAAVGPTRWLTVDCRRRHRCSYVVLDPAGGARRMLPGLAERPSGPPGVIAPDGSAAAVLSSVGGQLTLRLINLASGADQRVAVPVYQESSGLQALAWSPDSRWLFIVTARGRLAAVNARTERVQGLGLTLPPVSQIAVRNSRGQP
jgi:hypothetical protein